MTKVEVYSGDLEAALAQLKQKSEITMYEYRKHQAFTSNAAARSREEHRIETRRRSREKRRNLRQEAAKRRKDN